ncbi:SPOC like C-terminal domain-containing protein [Coprinopsis sp. MPI-PUGE-AT-0042]|nr:SPOC like C-terminal domain-containing protein [Coprinopsis sp. MPI-PUGE-AT-0042]
MAPYDDWVKVEDEDDEELQDYSMFEGKRDVILFCIDCSAFMQELYESPDYEDVQTCNLAAALNAAMEIEKRKIIVGPNDSVGIMLFNTTRKAEGGGYASEIKKGTYLFQPISLLSAPKVQELGRILEAAREDPEELQREFPSMKGRSVPIGDVFTSANWILRDGAPKTATKRVFLITDQDNPHSGPGSHQLTTSARTTLIDLTQAGVTVEPFFISRPNERFDVTKFYSSVLLPTNLEDEEELQGDSSVLPESISIARIEDLLEQMRFRETPKRALFSIPFHIGEGFTIGVKGYALVAEQTKGPYKYFADYEDSTQPVNVKTIYVDESRDTEVGKSQFVFGPAAGSSAAPDDDGNVGVRNVRLGQRPFFTSEEVRSFRTLGITPGISLLGFKPKEELVFEDNIKHSYFVYPDEMTYSGSKRTFSALLKSMSNKEKIALALVLMRRNASPVFCYLVPQEESIDENGYQVDPPGFHIIPLPFADDIRAAPLEEASRANDELVEAAKAWVSKLKVKQDAYAPDSYPNPALAYHNEQLQATAFRDDYDPESFVDVTLPPVKGIHKRIGEQMKEWKDKLSQDPAADIVVPTTGSKRKAVASLGSGDLEAEVRNHYSNDSLNKLKVDQLKEFLKSKSQPVSGKKADLIDRVSDWLAAH